MIAHAIFTKNIITFEVFCIGFVLCSVGIYVYGRGAEAMPQRVYSIHQKLLLVKLLFCDLHILSYFQSKIVFV